MNARPPSPSGARSEARSTALFARAQQLNGSKLHRVIVQLGFIDDELVQRKHNVAVVQSTIPSSLRSVPKRARGRADFDR